MALPQELMFQNQLQFNLNVPLTTHNMTTHFHRPQPITIERTFTLPPNQGFPIAQLAHRDSGGAARPGDKNAPDNFHFSAVSKDRMAAAVQMAQRDLKNQKQQRMNQPDGTRSPSPVSRQPQKPVYGTRQWEGQRSRIMKKVPSQAPVVSRGRRMGVKEHDRNRAPRSAGSQTPSSSPPRQAFLNTKLSPEKARSDSPPTRDTPSLTRVAREPSDDIEKLQLEMEMCLQQIESVQKRALSEHSTDFLRRGPAGATGGGGGGVKGHPPHNGSLRLVEEEGEERRQVRASEQSHRTLRTIYNLKQQMKEMDRQVGRLPRDSRATKKSQASQRLMMVNKGAVKLLHNFVAQLPQQDLHSGLPSHFSELAELVRQVTLLSAGSPQLDGKARDASSHSKKSPQLSPIEADVMAMVDQVERLDSDWRQEAMTKDTATVPTGQKPPFVTNFKNAKPAFMKEQVQQPPLLNNQLHSERKAVLQESIKALLNVGRPKKKGGKAKQNVRPYHAKLSQPPPPKGYSYKVPTRKPPPSRRRGFLLPYKVRAQKAPQPVTCQTATHFADPTITANLKASTMLHNPFVSNRSKSEPPSPRDSKKVSFIPPYASGRSHHASSYPGTGADRTRSFQRSLTSPPRLSHSHNPRFPGADKHRDRLWSSPPYHSDSEYSLAGYVTSGDESCLSPALSVESFPGRSGSHRSLSPVGGSKGRKQTWKGRSPRSRSPSPQRRQFFVTDADSDLVGGFFPEDRKTARTRRKDRNGTKSRQREVNLAPYMQEVERRVQERLEALARERPISDDPHSDHEDLDRIADTILEEAIEEATQEVTRAERNVAAGEVAASYIDNPTLENIMYALDNMEKENEHLRQKYCSVTFHDSVPRRHRYQKPSQVFAEFRSDQPREPPAFKVTNTRPAPQERLGLAPDFPEELSQEPLIFTRDSKAYRPHVTFQEEGGEVSNPLTTRPAPARPVQRQVPSAMRPKTLLSMKQTVVERITDSVERFDYYQRGLKHHLGKAKPFELYERVADNILKLCCEEVAQELEHINTDMAENIYTSEFLSETGLPLAPPGLAQDFETAGTAALNLRDSAAAQRTVEAAVSKTVTSLMLPPEEAELSVASPKRVIDKEGEASPGCDSSLKHVYDATALYEASVTPEKPAVDVSQGRSGAKEDDTHVDEDDYDYDDDYTDISDEEEDETDESPSP
ncbi:hypothetical protein ACOMHN_056673 [Nucella lapillus]